MDTVPHPLCRLILVQRATDDTLLVPLCLVVANPHGDPAPSRLARLIISHFHNALVLNRVLILGPHKLLARDQVLLDQ